jgi:hypothetical protein
MRRTALLLLAALALPAAVAAQTQITGRFLYTDKAWDWNGWTGQLPTRPVRRADVSVINNASGAILASGSTAQDGSFALAVTLGGPTDLLVRCDADSDLNGSFQRVRVTTEANAEYAVSSAVFQGVTPATALLDTGTTTALTVLSGSAEGGPFNLFDMAISAAEYVSSSPLNAAASTQTVRLYWPGDGGSFASGNGAHISADDGYDDAVILHELGHVIQNLYCDSDNPGGSHGFGDSDQDPLLSFGEGYATFFAGCVMDRLGMEAIYQDANGAAHNGGSQLRARLETVAPYSTDAFGICDELSVACSLFDIIDTETSVDAAPGTDDDGFTAATQVHGLPPALAWWQVFVGPLKVATNLCMNHAWDGWLSVHAAEPHYSELQGVFEARRMRFWNDATEPDDSMATASLLPGVTGTAWSVEHTLYSSAGQSAPGTGDQDWFAVPLVKGDVVDFATRYPNAAADADTQCDTFLEVYDPNGVLVASAEDGGAGRNAKITAQAIGKTGTWTYRVKTNSAIRRYGRYEVRAKWVSQNHLPVITAGPTASPDTITTSGNSLLSASASDQDAGQTLSYAWTPLEGGAIVGSGPAVTFTPPALLQSTTLHVQLVVSDNLGAESVAKQVAITVNPVGGPCSGAAAASAGGTGKAGALGVPVLTPVNLPKLPSNDFALHATNCYPLKPATLAFGFSLISANFDGGKLYPSPDLMLPLGTSAAGELLLPLTLAADPVLCGVTLYAQLLIPGDPGAAGGKKTAQTNYVALTFGN